MMPTEFLQVWYGVSPLPAPLRGGAAGGRGGVDRGQYQTIRNVKLDTLLPKLEILILICPFHFYRDYPHEKKGDLYEKIHDLYENKDDLFERKHISFL